MSPVRTVGWVWLAVLGLANANLDAQAPAPAPAREQGPPTVRFSPDGLTLEEAVRLTLDNDADLLRAQADVDRRLGALQEQQGAFDLSLLGTFSFDRRVQELTESRKGEELKKRTDTQNSIAEQEKSKTELDRTQSLVRRVQASPTDAAALRDLAALSPSLSSTIQILNQLIASTPSQAAAYTTIRNDVLAQAVRTGDDLVRETTLNLDATKVKLQNLGAAPEDEVFNDLNFKLQLSKPFRSGAVISPYFDSAFSSTGFVGKPHQAEFGGKGLTDLYTFHAGTQLFIPLARGRGARATGAFERAAALDVQAAEQTLTHQASVSALNTVLAYWRLRAAQETAEISAVSLQFQQQLVQLTQGRAADLPGAELARAQAGLARAQAQQQDAQRSFKDARVALAVSMGIAATADDLTLPTRARDAFPAPPAPAALAAPSMAGLLQTAGQREDLTAAQRTSEANAALTDAARTNVRPILDLKASTYYTALDEGDGGKALDRWVGPSASAALNFERPFGNNRQQGQLAQREAELRLSRIDQEDLARRIRLSVAQSMSTLQETVTRVQQTQIAVNLYQTTVTAQFQRLQAGDASVIDTVTTQQQQNDTLLSLVAARAELARQIADVRFRTGTLVNGREVRAADLVTVPSGTQP